MQWMQKGVPGLRIPIIERFQTTTLVTSGPTLGAYQRVEGDKYGWRLGWFFFIELWFSIGFYFSPKRCYTTVDQIVPHRNKTPIYSPSRGQEEMRSTHLAIGMIPICPVPTEEAYFSFG
jgi:hypothetical protein